MSRVVSKRDYCCTTQICIQNVGLETLIEFTNALWWGVIVKYSPRICIDLTDVHNQGWGGGADPWTALASAAPGLFTNCQTTASY